MKLWFDGTANPAPMFETGVGALFATLENHAFRGEL